MEFQGAIEEFEIIPNRPVSSFNKTKANRKLIIVVKVEKYIDTSMVPFFAAKAESIFNESKNSNSTY
jgi:hypothetical protein